MKRSLSAALVGACATAAVAAVPLWFQHQRLASLNFVSTESGNTTSTIIGRWNAFQSSSDSPNAQLLAAESVQNLTASECRSASDAALASGNHSPLSDFLGRWASVDGKEAFNWLAGHPSVINQVLRDAGPAWAASDPAGYAEWLVHYLPARQWGNEYDSYTYCKWLAPHDLCAAIRIAMEKFRESQSMGGTSSNQLRIGKLELRPFIRSGKDARELADEIVQHPEWLTPLRVGEPMELLSALLQCWQEVDAAGWNEWVAQHPELAARADNKPQNPGEVLLVSQNPRAAAAQLMREAPPGKESEVLVKLMAAWTHLDLNAAGTWLNTLPDSPLKWEGMQRFALAAMEDPAAAMQWADEISAPAPRDRAQRRVFTAWFDNDPAAAAAWLAQSSWNESQIQAAHDIMTSGKPRGK